MEAKVPQSEIPAVYDSLSKTYDIWGRLAETRARDRAIELADIKDGQISSKLRLALGWGFMRLCGATPAAPISGWISPAACCTRLKKDLAN